MRRLTKFQQLNFGGVLALSLIAWLLSSHYHLVTSYSDAMSHLDIARLVVDDKQPGLAQLGSVWLPLNQLLYLPLIWNNWAWHSGFAGSIVSMVSYIFATIGIYKIAWEISAKRLAALVAATAFALNPNLLYLQSTPLTEPLFVVLLVASTLFLVRYVKTHQPKFLALTAIFTALQVLTRYDGWFVAIVELLVIVYTERRIFKQAWRKTIGSSVMFALPVVLAAGLWFLWNYLIFGSALYSFTGPYSAHAQQATIEAGSGLITKLNLAISTKTYLLDIIANTGIAVALLSLIGWIVYLKSDRKISAQLRWLFVSLFVADIIFNIVALFAGFSILNLPVLHWNPTHDLAGAYFNVRYGVTALPFVALGFGMLATKRQFPKIIAGSLIVVVLLQGGVLLHQGLITVKDGTIGSSAFNNQDIAVALKSRVGPKDTVIMSSSTYNGVMFESGLNLDQFIHEGVSAQWKAAIASPDAYARWVVTANGNFGDPVYNSLVNQEKNAFLKYYKLAYAGKHANLYERRTSNDVFVSVKGAQLNTSGSPLIIRGVNDYDLAYQTKDQITATFKHLQAARVNTVRFWLYGDGINDGFQPSVGVVNSDALAKTDYIFQLAHRYGIRLIPTLGNNYDDYGGAKQYLAWAGVDPNDHDQFFTNPAVRTLYENYLNHILTHLNRLTDTTYANDPTVLAWDILNEPRATDPSVIVPWETAVGNYVHQRDSNHLITISIDKPVVDSSLRPVCAVKSITLCSIHIYPQEPNIASYDNSVALQTAVKTYRKTANDLDKSLLVSEIGASKAGQPFGQLPLTILGNTISTLNNDDYSGWLIWNYSEKPDSSFGFSANGQAGYNLAGLHWVLSR